LEAYERALNFGVPKDRMTLLPYGVDISVFQPADPEIRLELRRRYGIPLDSAVVLCVAAINRGHKRVDRLVHAMSLLKGDYRLILCGKIEDQTIIEEANTLLGKRFTHLYVDPVNMNEVYALADMFVLPSLIEGFGLVVLEAALSGLPVLVHDSPHFKWMLGPRWQTFADMSNPESLVETLQMALGNLSDLRLRMEAIRGELVDRFEWSNLLPRYLEMYQHALETPPATIAQVMGRI
jgi:glycosyltransferase involved in cell wall biosynthesis